MKIKYFKGPSHPIDKRKILAVWDYELESLLSNLEAKKLVPEKILEEQLDPDYWEGEAETFSNLIDFLHFLESEKEKILITLKRIEELKSISEPLAGSFEEAAYEAMDFIEKAHKMEWDRDKLLKLLYKLSDLSKKEEALEEKDDSLFAELAKIEGSIVEKFNELVAAEAEEIEEVKEAAKSSINLKIVKGEKGIFIIDPKVKEMIKRLEAKEEISMDEILDFLELIDYELLDNTAEYLKCYTPYCDKIGEIRNELSGKISRILTYIPKFEGHKKKSLELAEKARDITQIGLEIDREAALSFLREAKEADDLSTRDWEELFDGLMDDFFDLLGSISQIRDEFITEINKYL